LGLLHVGAERTDVTALIASLRSRLPACVCRKSVALLTDDEVSALAAAAYLSHERVTGAVLGRNQLHGVAARLRELGMTTVDLDRGAVLAPARRAPGVSAGTVFLLTSGSTGAPKLVAHSWDSLFTANRVRLEQPVSWWLTYRPGTYAWYQMVTMWLFLSGNDLSVCGAGATPGALDQARAAGVDALSCTPSFFRLLLVHCGMDRCRTLGLKRVTFGGEPVDDAVLQDARTLFPQAVLTHIYASSEAGAAIVVRDGRAGFPASYLDRPASSGIRLRVEDGVLLVRSPYASIEGEEWVHTGDLVEVVDGRVQFLGRSGAAFISVGGAKVPTRLVEACLLRHPDVLWCKVVAQRAPLLGSVVAAQVVQRPGAARERQDLERELVRHCRNELPEVMCPRLFTVLDTVPVTAAFKTQLETGPARDRT